MKFLSQLNTLSEFLFQLHCFEAYFEAQIVCLVHKRIFQCLCINMLFTFLSESGSFQFKFKGVLEVSQIVNSYFGGFGCVVNV